MGRRLCGSHGWRQRFARRTSACLASCAIHTHLAHCPLPLAVQVNGYPKVQAPWSRVCGYVEQQVRQQKERKTEFAIGCWLSRPAGCMLGGPPCRLHSCANTARVWAWGCLWRGAAGAEAKLEASRRPAHPSTACLCISLSLSSCPATQPPPSLCSSLSATHAPPEGT